MEMDDATTRMDLQSHTEAPCRPSSDDAAVVAFVVPFAMAAAGMVAVGDID